MAGGKENAAPASLIEIVKQYVSFKTEYYRLSLVEKVSVLIGKLTLIIFSAIFSLALLLLTIWLVYNLLMSAIGIAWLVTVIEIGLILLLMCILWIFRDRLIINPVANSIIRVLLDDDKEEKEDNNERG